MNLLSPDKPTKELDLMEIFDEMLRLDAQSDGIGKVLVLFGSRKKYEELFHKACENVVEKMNNEQKKQYTP